MSSPKTRTSAALCAGAALLVLSAGWSPAVAEATATTAAIAASSGVAPAPPAPPAPGGALPVHPAGGGACIIGLNCGCIRNITCPKPHPRPPNPNGEQHAAPAPPNP